MAGKRHKPEEIVAKLRQVEVLTAQGHSIAEAVRTIAARETTYFSWRSEYGGMKSDPVKRLKALEAENARLRRAAAGWVVNAKRVERLWRREGLRIPHKQPKRGRLWLADGSCLRLRAERANHVWSDDFVEDRTRDGRKCRMLCLIDAFTREAWRSSVSALPAAGDRSAASGRCGDSERPANSDPALCRAVRDDWAAGSSDRRVLSIALRLREAGWPRDSGLRRDVANLYSCPIAAAVSVRQAGGCKRVDPRSLREQSWNWSPAGKGALSREQVKRQLAAILAADLVGYTV